MLIVPYTSDWIEDYNKIRLELDAALNGHDYRIEHVGSTSVPDLAAKAIIDIDIIYETDADFLRIKSHLQAIGYFHNGDQGIPYREAFKRTGMLNNEVLDKIEHHLYVCLAGCPALKRHLLFRNHLRKNQAALLTYEAMKYKLAEKAEQDRKQYAALKELHVNDFIDDIIQIEGNL
ncbi:MAG: GrpB family protein [Roseivirga sp.]|nr:GrpB family protein [Roseivirga sp.]